MNILSHDLKIFSVYRNMKLDLGNIFAVKNIAKSSQTLYEKNLKRLNDGNEVKNFKFLKDKEAILKKMKKY
jgi:hypothetical protein